MYISKEVESTIVSEFNLENLDVGFHRVNRETGANNERFFVDYIWILHLCDYFHLPLTLATVSTTKYKDTNDDRTRSLLVGQGKAGKIGQLNLSPIETGDANVFKNSLETFNLLPCELPAAIADDDTSQPCFSLHTYTCQGFANFVYDGAGDNKDIQLLWQTIIKTFTDIIQKYDNDKLNHILQYPYF